MPSTAAHGGWGCSEAAEGDGRGVQVGTESFVEARVASPAVTGGLPTRRDAPNRGKVL